MSPETVAALGTKKDGWTPKVLAKLKRGMKPEEAGQVFPGAENISQYGFSKVPVTDIPGIVAFRVLLRQEQGRCAERSAVREDPLRLRRGVRRAGADVRGEVRPRMEKGAVEKMLVIWINHKFRLATLSKSTDKGSRYALDIKM